ncbi:uncharacterized protein F5Z01DRAFT_663780 [Emericellopsis atlantica]|uniref:Glutamine synthetase n=1 Tax=Emericellopsis atlantica TaxID=2614577 RepID=A0A9P8CLD4_9HYPO|nr:uncharacterized protein F5Z01DRAFT_663780 [Emericellopsis atlantica]KAG9251278.1 hypothetical protein F5Z01DRAFT_663780 [Emericellopsis atlantica]
MVALINSNNPLPAKQGEAAGSDSNASVIEELQSFHCKWLRFCWHDYTSTARCRLMPMKRVLAMLEHGQGLDLSITMASMGLLQSDTMIPEVTGTGMYAAHPDWSSLRRGPAQGHATVSLDFKESDGSDVVFCPRTVLRKSVERASSHGLSFLLGFELEFIILEPNPEAGNQQTPRHRAMHNDAHGWSKTRAIAEIGRDGSFISIIDELLDTLSDASIEIEQFHPETAPGQYEVVLPPLPPLEACDALLRTRDIVEAVAARHNFLMTLHPKPFATSSGSASHVHVSISSPGGNDRQVYEPFYAGILKHYPALLAFTYANPTSYERMVDSFWAGGRWVAWGTQNKEAPLRKCQDSHWEMKTLDGLANPYLAMAAILSAGTSGVTSREILVWGDCAKDPAKLTAEEREQLGVTVMFPRDLKDALRALEADKALGEVLGHELVQRYMDVKRGELSILDPMSAEERREWVLQRY